MLFLGRIPLHYSVQHYSTYISQLLIKYGANVDSVDYTEATPAHFTAKEGQVENACLLLTFGADFCARDKMGKTAFDVAAEEGHTEVCDAKLVKKFKNKISVNKVFDKTKLSSISSLTTKIK